MTRRNLVVGYGNPLRGDDALGWHAAAALAADPRPADTDVVTRHQLTPELAEDIAAARAAVLIDARLGDPPGCVSIREVAPAPGSSWSHQLRPEDVVGLAQALFGAVPPVFLVTVTGAHFGYGSRLSRPVRDRIPRVLMIVEAVLRPPLSGEAPDRGMSRSAAGHPVDVTSWRPTWTARRTS
jgi:hydrogenase maturation protease